MDDHRLEKITTAGFILKPNDPGIKVLFERIKSEFEAKGIKVLLAERSAGMIGLKGIPFENMCEAADFLVSLGGDGTLLSLVRRSYGYHKPVVGINAGNLGFLADITIDDVDNFLAQLLNGEYRIDERMMIEGYIRKISGEKQPFFAFNDVVISRPVISKMVQINASIDGEMFNGYKGDGLIVATPTGSTAYNLASGGPVMYPLTEAFILTPIDEKVIAIIDGQDAYEVFEGDVLVIKGAKRGARLLHRKERNYFSVLREKLSWGDRH
ncbi:MAG: hypothetical protein RL113_1354 [Pseudomonadota bacterium]